MNRDNLRKVQVRDMERDIYIGYSLNKIIPNENNEICLAVESEEGYIELVQVDRVKFIDIESEDK